MNEPMTQQTIARYTYETRTSLTSYKRWGSPRNVVRPVVVDRLTGKEVRSGCQHARHYTEAPAERCARALFRATVRGDYPRDRS